MFENILDVVDFILGYGKYLEELGFTLVYSREDTYDVSDWQTSVREFYIDYTKLEAGTVLV